jgi:septum site-determining protein MinD
MSRTICVASVKGGVGKTTTVSNLASSLTKLGYNVLAVDANMTGSNLGLHLGISSRNIITLHDVLKNDMDVKEAVYKHELGFHVVLGGIYLEDVADINYEKFGDKINTVKELYDFVLIDCSAGLNNETLAAVKNCDEVLIVTNSELPSVANAFKLVEYAEHNWIPITGVVVNKERNTRYKDITIQDVEEILGKRVIQVVPHDDKVIDSVSLKKPVTNMFPKSGGAEGFIELAHKIVGKEYKNKKSPSLLDKIFSLFR